MAKEKLQPDEEFVEVTEVPPKAEAPKQKKMDWSVLLILAAIAYLISPIDIIPEALLGPLGLADDAAVLAYLIKLLYDKLRK